MWCDGVLMPYVESQWVKKIVNDSRKIETTTWIGIGLRNQVEFELIIHFGKYALRRYAKGKTLDYCIPSLENVQSNFFDIKNLRIELHLL